MSMTELGERGAVRPRCLIDWAAAGVVPDIIVHRSEAIATEYGMSFTFQSARLEAAADRWKASRPVRDRLLAAPHSSELESEIAEMVILDDFGRLTREILGQEGSICLSGLPASTFAKRAAKTWPSGFATYAILTTLCRDALEGTFTGPSLPDRILDAAFLASVKENYAEDQDTARPYLAVMLGRTPRWTDFYYKLV